LTEIDWIITGGESGSGHRRFDPGWAIDIRDAAACYGTAFLHKQNGGARPKSNGRLLDGRWLTERDLIATASAPKDPADNPLENGNLKHEATEGDVAYSRSIGVPDPNAPEPEPEVAPETDEVLEDPSGGTEAPKGAEDEPTAEEAARKDAEAAEAAREKAAKQKIEEAEEREREEKAVAEKKAKDEAEARAKAAKKTPAEEAAQRVAKGSADVRPAAKQGAEQTANSVEEQGSGGEGSSSSSEQVGTPDALSD
jgi:hypothetical protein